MDSAGDAYITGFTTSDIFPTIAGAFQTEPGSDVNNNAFVAKLNPTGSALVYSTYLGGSEYSFLGGSECNQGNAIAVDSSGDAYVTGATTSTDFPITAAPSRP